VKNDHVETSPIDLVWRFKDFREALALKALSQGRGASSEEADLVSRAVMILGKLFGVGFGARIAGALIDVENASGFAIRHETRCPAANGNARPFLKAIAKRLW